MLLRFRTHLRWAVILLLVLASAEIALAQSIASGGSRPFVTGFTPVIGSGGRLVGGIEIDADGVLRRSQHLLGLAPIRDRVAAVGITDDLRRPSPLRSVSLRRLEAELRDRLSSGRRLDPAMLYLAGLQRIEFVFVYPETADIVIAGPAEGWGYRGDVAVGTTSDKTVLRLDHLLDALRGDAAARGGTDGITCSIDPRPEGLARVQRMLGGRRAADVDESLLRQLETWAGVQDITVTGIRHESHFAGVMVASDYLMKRIAMQIEPSGVPAVPSFLSMAQTAVRPGRFLAPRWWMAMNYQPPQRDEPGLSWRLTGPGVRVLSEHGFLEQRGRLVNTGRPLAQTQRWADRFTAQYEPLSRQHPVLGQLRGCFDVALLAALIDQEDLWERAGGGFGSTLRTPDATQLEKYPVARSVASVASVSPSRRGWIVAVSGGVQLDTWNVLEATEIDPKLTSLRLEAAGESTSWWWDADVAFNERVSR